MTYAEQSHEYTREYQRALWRWCAETVAARSLALTRPAFVGGIPWRLYQREEHER